MIRNRKKLFLLLFSLFLVYLVEFTASWFTQSSVASWYPLLTKPHWTPPDWVFPVAWTILYTMIGISLWRILIIPEAVSRRALLPFALQLLLNFSWSFAFFYLRSPLFGLVNIVLLVMAILWNIAAFNKHSTTAALLLIPYLLWVIYATALNFAIWTYN